jgi:hypothetical protein
MFLKRLNMTICKVFSNVSPLQGLFLIFFHTFYKYLGGAAAKMSCRAAKYL